MKRAIIILVCVALFTGCPTEASIDEEWTPVQSASEIYGVWEGKTTIPVDADPPLPASSLGCTIHLTVQASQTIVTVTLDFSKFLDDMGFRNPIAKQLAWAMMKDDFAAILADPDSDIIPSVAGEIVAIEPQDDYKIRITFEAAGEMSVADYMDLSINRNRNKLKMFIDGSEAPLEVILHKK